MNRLPRKDLSRQLKTLTTLSRSGGTRINTNVTATRANRAKEPIAGPSRSSTFLIPKNNLRSSHKRSFQSSSRLAYHSVDSETRKSVPTPLDEITRLRELINRANATNSKLTKEKILTEYSDLRSLLAYIYDPYCRMHTTSASVYRYLKQRERDEDWQNEQAPSMMTTSNRSKERTRTAALRNQREEISEEEIPSTLLDLFELLSSREVTGARALAMIKRFLDHHGIIDQHNYAMSPSDDPNLSTSELFRKSLLRPTALEVFFRCLDRNLKAGFSEKILKTAFSNGKEKGQRTNSRASNTGSGVFEGSFEVALGKTISRAELPSLFASNGESPMWYASRKLDGVRCLFVIECRFTHADLNSDLEILSVQSYSRNGRHFTTLSVLEEEMRKLLPSCQAIKTLLSSERRDAEQEEADSTERFVLDGEVCVLSEPKDASEKAAKGLKVETATDLDQSALMESHEAEKPFVEDFAAVVGLIKRKDFTIPSPAYFPFDLLTFNEFTQWRSGKARNRTFAKRVAIIQEVIDHFQSQATEGGRPSVIRRLEQVPVRELEAVEKMISTASQKGWEGVILRQDVPYEGKRTPAIRKFKEWKDAEYTVQGISIATMRLPIAGEYQEREAMAAIQIDHKGTKVSVGSGFTPEERIAFAKNPEEIVGKVATVEFFEESTTIQNNNVSNTVPSTNAGEDTETSSSSSVSKPNGVNYSLRFPRIKQIWGDKRDI